MNEFEKKLGKRNSEQDYKDEHKHEKIVLNKHFIHDILTINPLSIHYEKYWKEIKRKCIEGYWFEGKWMPGPLYFYINTCKIRLNRDNNAKSKITARPFLRDLEWELFYVYTEAKGFSGFTDDDVYTCNRNVEETIELTKRGEDWEGYIFLPPECYNSKGEMKKYVPAREYLRKIHSTNLGKPLYQNNAKNVMSIQARETGKSYSAAGMIGNNFLMDGCTDYDEFLMCLQQGTFMTTDTLVGAIESKFAKDLLTKVEFAMQYLEGEQVFQGKVFPSPLSKEYAGSWYSGKGYIEALTEKKIGGTWKMVGSSSKIYNKSFQDNPIAGNGTRNSLVALEEVGFHYNLIDTLGALKDTTYNGANKYGVIMMLGTGGQMASGASEAAREVFTNPTSYDCLCFNDIWEGTGDIGYFVPYELRLNQFKNEEGATNIVQASRFADSVRDKLIKGKSKKPLYDEMQNNPRVPSEAFFTQNANIFPTAELKEHVNWLKSMQHDRFIKGQNGELVWKQSEGAPAPLLEWQPDLQNKLTPRWYKMNKADSTTGCIQIWEHPERIDGVVPHGLYLAGNDPYDQDQSTTNSLGSTIIYKTFLNADSLYEMPVAEYTARPATAEEHHENVRKLLLYYNAVCLYENERNTLKMHFSHQHSLYLLAKTPTILKATEGSKVERQYGIHMTDHIKDELEIYTRDWLLKDAGGGKLNLHKINSIPIIEELIAYNRIGNFDRVIAFMLVICNRLSHHHMKVEASQSTIVQDDFITKMFSGQFYR